MFSGARVAKTRQDLLEFLDANGIAVTTTEHPPLHTVADSQALRGEIAGAHTKNLFVRDKKGRYFLITVEEEAVVDLKSIHQLIGASGRVSFGRPEALAELLGVAPGAVTALGAINDTAGAVTVVVDAALLDHEIINAHPLVNTATTSIRRDDFLRFLRATGHEPLVLKVSS